MLDREFAMKYLSFRYLKCIECIKMCIYSSCCRRFVYNVHMFYHQRNNDCKGGMMEEWHQKLHNNSSPDDVIICEVF